MTNARRIEDVTEFVLDGTHGSPTRTESGVPVLSAMNVKHGRLDFNTERFTSEDEYRAFRSRLDLRANDVLLTIVGTIGRAAVVSDVQAAIFQRSVAILRPRAGVLDSRYFFHATQTAAFQNQLDRSANTSSQAGVYLGRLKEITLPVPPLAQQVRIAKTLDGADTLRAKRRRALAQLDALAQSIFLDMFGDPVTNPKGWARRATSAIGEVITGNTPPRAVASYYGPGIEWIKSDNVNTPEYYLTRAAESLSQDGRAVARIAPAGAILITCIAGSPDCIGNSGLADREVAFNQQINAFVPFEGDPHFYYGQLRVGKALIQAASTSGMKGMVSKGRFEQITLICPPLPLQKTFAHRIAAVEKLKAAHRASLAELDALFASLQHRAFRGEL